MDTHSLYRKASGPPAMAATDVNKHASEHVGEGAGIPLPMNATEPQPGMNVSQESVITNCEQNVVLLADNGHKDYQLVVIQKSSGAPEGVIGEGQGGTQVEQLMDPLDLVKNKCEIKAGGSESDPRCEQEGPIESSDVCQPGASSHQESPHTTSPSGGTSESEPPSEISVVIKGLNDERCIKVLHKVNSMRLMNHLGCDIVWIVNNEVLWAHSCILSANSAVLEAMLKKTPEQAMEDRLEPVRQLDIPCDSVQVAKDFLSYIYTGRLSATLDTIPGLLNLSQTLGIPDLRTTCVKALCENIGFLSWPVLLQAAGFYEMPELWKALGRFLWNNMDSLKATPDFLLMSFSDLQAVLSNGSRTTRPEVEAAKLKAICHWVRMDTETRNQHYVPLISLVDLEMMKPYDLQDIRDEGNECLLDNPKMKSLLERVTQAVENIEIKRKKCNKRKSSGVTRLPSKEVLVRADSDYEVDMDDGEDAEDQDYTPGENYSEIQDYIDGVGNYDSSQEASKPPRKKRGRPPGSKGKKGPKKSTKTKSETGAKKRGRPKKMDGIKSENSMEKTEKEAGDLEDSEVKCEKDSTGGHATTEGATEEGAPRKRGPKPKKERGTKVKKPRVKKEKQEGPFFCPMEGCTKLFRDRGSMRYHQRSHNPGTPLLCDICGFTTHHPKSLQGHMGIHVGMKHKCDFPGCNFGCVGPGKLREHKNKHLGVRDNICHICGKTFTYIKHLQRHERTHFPQEFHHCPICDYKNVRSDKLRVHIKGHHKHYSLENGFIKPDDVEKYLQVPEKRRIVRPPPDPNAPPKKRRLKKRPDSAGGSDMMSPANEELHEAIKWAMPERDASAEPWGQVMPVSGTAAIDMSALQPGWYSMALCTQQAEGPGHVVEQPQLQVPVAIYAEDNTPVFGGHV